MRILKIKDWLKERNLTLDRYKKVDDLNNQRMELFNSFISITPLNTISKEWCIKYILNQDVADFNNFKNDNT